jgi:CheY-like chemotaxis protein
MTGRRVLLVDDEGGTREAYAEILAMEGYEVRAAAHGASALTALDGWPPDLVVLDTRMPVMDGWALAGKLRARLGEGLPILVTTASSKAGEWAREIGAEEVLAKTFALDELLGAVARLAARGLGRSGVLSRPFGGLPAGSRSPQGETVSPAARR